MKFLRSRFILIGVLAGLLLGGGWFAWAAIQSQVGINVVDQGTSLSKFVPVCSSFQNSDTNPPITSSTGCKNISSSSPIYAWNNSTNNWERIRVGSADGLNTTGILANANYGFNGTTYDRLTTANAMSVFPTATSTATKGIQVGSLFVLDTTNSQWRTIRSLSDLSNDLNGTVQFGVGLLAYNGNGTGSNWARVRQASTSTLTSSPLEGVLLTLPASNVSCTSSPAAATQATCTLAAGAGTVRHVATSITACYTQDTGVSSHEQANLRDGASGAGTILWSALIGTSAVHDTKCVTISGLAITGSATTAMTLEFSAAGPANTLESVTLTALNVQ